MTKVAIMISDYVVVVGCCLVRFPDPLVSWGTRLVVVASCSNNNDNNNTNNEDDDNDAKLLEDCEDKCATNCAQLSCLGFTFTSKSVSGSQ